MPQNTAGRTMDILRKVRNISNLHEDAQLKFAKIMQVVAKQMELAAAACYVVLDDTYLERIACEASNFPQEIKKSARLGFGLVGEVAKTNCPMAKHLEVDGQNLCFYAIPLVKWSRSNGVLMVVQKDNPFSEDQIETIETLGMLLSELLAAPEIMILRDQIIKERGMSDKNRMKGQSLNKGFGIGNAVIHRRLSKVTKIFAEDKEFEKARLSSAFLRMNNDLDEKFNETKLGIGEHVDILDAYKMFAKDKGWYRRIEENISGGLTAEASAERAYEDMWKRLSISSDPYLQEKLHDLRDITDRLIGYINDRDEKHEDTKSYKDIIIVAGSMGPADLLDYDYGKIRGLIIEDGTPTMHVAIVAKALNIPVIVKIKGISSELKNGEMLAMDGDNGYVYVSPSKAVIQKISAQIEDLKEHTAKIAKLRNLPSKTKDGVRIGLNLNVGLPFDFDYMETTNCDGVGLYRTEIPFMSAPAMPNVKTQVENYRALLDRAGNKRVVFRSLDVGSDKLLPYWSSIVEDNPAIGWRSIRITLDRRAILRRQMSAFLQAAIGKELYVMFPMVADLEEFLEARETLMIELEKEKKVGRKLPEKVYVGLMIEVPSVVLQLDEILKYADFISVGTNDLAQFVFACDRGNPRLTDRYDVLSVPFLRLMKEIVDKANKAGVYCSVCGEMASNPIEALALIGIGYRNLSSSGAAFGNIKAMVRSTNVETVQDYMQVLLNSQKMMLRPQLLSYAYDHGIEIY